MIIYIIFSRIIGFFLYIVKSLYSRPILLSLLCITWFFTYLDRINSLMDNTQMRLAAEFEEGVKDVFCEKVRFGSLKSTVKTPGTVIARRETIFSCQLPNGGIVSEKYVKNGQKISEGCKIISFESDEITDDLENSHKKLQRARKINTIIHKLPKNFTEVEKIKSESDILDSTHLFQKNLRNITNTNICAPFSGTVEFITEENNSESRNKREIVEGQFLQRGESFAKLIDDEELCVNFYVSPELIDTKIKKDAIVYIAYKDMMIEAKIIEYTRSLVVSMNKCKVKALLINDNYKSFPKINEMVKVIIPTEEVSNVFIVSRSCVESINNEHFIYKVRPSQNSKSFYFVTEKIPIDIRASNEKEIGFNSVNITQQNHVIKHGIKREGAKIKVITK